MERIWTSEREIRWAIWIPQFMTGNKYLTQLHVQSVCIKVHTTMYCACFVIINRILWIKWCTMCDIFPSFVDSNAKLGVFCLLRLGSQVLDTQSLVVVDRAMTDISFPDVMILWVGRSRIIQGEEMHYDYFQWNFVPLHCKLHVHVPVLCTSYTQCTCTYYIHVRLTIKCMHYCM